MSITAVHHRSIMRLEDIGFYTLSNERARTSGPASRLMRAEIILTDRCNFRCPYCRGVRSEARGDMPISSVLDRLDFCAAHRLYAVRFSGGEPTVYPHLIAAVEHAKGRGIEKIALSTNGSANPSLYGALLQAGVNDFSISLDACCSSTGDTMAGVRGAWQKVIDNIALLSSVTYVTVGIVLTDNNTPEAAKTIRLAHNLGVADIRIIPAAQCGRGLALEGADILPGHPILAYRMNRMKAGLSVRGLTDTDHNRCPLIHDDLIFAGEYHYPCIIHFRESGQAIGRWGGDIRKERSTYALTHDTQADQICRRNCLDVCVEYNNVWAKTNESCMAEIDAL